MTANPVIFLDIDGVLIAYPEGEPTPPMFTPRCVEAFKTVLEAVPKARIVFSTTWRYPKHINGLHEQWLAHGFPVSLAWDGTPDTRENPGVPRFSRRGAEIRMWLDAHPEITNYVVIDDDIMSTEPIMGRTRCVYTNPATGMTLRDAEKAIGILAE